MASRLGLGGVDIYAACAPEGLENGCEPLIEIVPEGVTRFFQRGYEGSLLQFNLELVIL